MSKRGKLIVIEGTDRSGKQTQRDLLIRKMQTEDFPCDTISFPTYDTTASGRIIGQCYLGKDRWGEDNNWFLDPDSVDPWVASLYYAANRREELPNMLKTFNSRIHLISDRYVESNMGHQGGKLKTPEQRRELYEKIDQLEYGILELPRPDLVVFLYMPYQVGMELGGKMTEKSDGHESNENHLKNAENAYLELAEMYDNWQKIECAPSGNMDSLKTPEQIHEQVWDIVSPVLTS